MEWVPNLHIYNDRRYLVHPRESLIVWYRTRIGQKKSSQLIYKQLASVMDEDSGLVCGHQLRVEILSFVQKLLTYCILIRKINFAALGEKKVQIARIGIEKKKMIREMNFISVRKCVFFLGKETPVIFIFFFTFFHKKKKEIALKTRRRKNTMLNVS